MPIQFASPRATGCTAKIIAAANFRSARSKTGNSSGVSAEGKIAAAEAAESKEDKNNSRAAREHMIFTEGYPCRNRRSDALCALVFTTEKTLVKRVRLIYNSKKRE